jgi:protease II
LRIEKVLLEDIEIFSNYLVVEERSNGLNHIELCLGVGKVLLALEETYNAYTRPQMLILTLISCVTAINH